MLCEECRYIDNLATQETQSASFFLGIAWVEKRVFLWIWDGEVCCHNFNTVRDCQFKWMNAQKLQMKLKRDLVTWSPLFLGKHFSSETQFFLHSFKCWVKRWEPTQQLLNWLWGVTNYETCATETSRWFTNAQLHSPKFTTRREWEAFATDYQSTLL